MRVVVERGIDDPALADGLTYRAIDDQVQVGDRVTVPLGRGGKATGGIVVAIEPGEAPPGVRIKSVIERSESRLLPALIELARWMSRYYASPLGMVLSTMVPAAVKHGVGRRMERLVARTDGAGLSPVEGLAPSARRAWEKILALGQGVFPLHPRELLRRIGEPDARGLNALIRAGVMVEVVRSVVRSAEAFWRSADEPAPPDGTPDGPPDVSLGGPSVVAPRGVLDAIPDPTCDQVRCVEGISARLGEFGVHVLRGVTGSGKTEVYLRLIDRVRTSGRSAVVLVPEISLTPQTVRRFEARFGSSGVAVLHSGLSSAQRHRHWLDAATGRARIVVGARSAVFAPVEQLGLVIVDEEHDTSYKQDQAPRYNGRDVAVKRAQVEGCPVVLGSATPSLESWNNVRTGRACLWELPRRVGGGTLPEVTVADLAEENRARAREPGKKPSAGGPALRAIGPTLEHAIDGTLNDGGQVILLLNRRGFANYICCPSRACGWLLVCDQCEAAMVLHRDARLPRGGVVVCHHCQSEQRVPPTCPACGRPPLALGVGTQRVEEELVERFGASHGLVLGDSLARVDSDTMRSARDYFETLGRFGRGQVRLMVGTQMISKGLDFPNVRLVGVVNADTAVWMPDFRAWERTFQLVSQVAGRAGRGREPGRVIVQTACPHNPAIRLAALHDYVTFADAELAIRREGGLPPSTRMARIVCRDEDDARAEAAAQRIGDQARREASGEVDVDGPRRCVLGRLNGQHRHAVELTARRASDIQRVLWALRTTKSVVSDAATAVDVDPISFL